MNKELLGGSFRDPGGRVVISDGVLVREISYLAKNDYDKLMSSGLYDNLTKKQLLVKHEECLGISSNVAEDIYKIIKPEIISFISYPYEWSFGQLKDAALLTLAIQKLALDYNMVLKDASAYNVQFQGCKPIFIDTLSFESYEEGKPWNAYRQFCQHFFAPLLLCRYCDISLNRLLQIYLDGIPLDIASRLLPFKTKFNSAVYMHIHLHARFQNHVAGQEERHYRRKTGQVSKKALLGIIDSLESAIKKLKWQDINTEWADYYNKGNNNYSSIAFEEKRLIIDKYIEQVNPQHVWDIGANCGVFSRLASKSEIMTVSMDIDLGAVELNYQQGRKEQDQYLLPLIMDLTNPSPSIGWHLRERFSILERGPVDMIFALALIHHLAIGNNLPFSMIAEFFASICEYLVIEFVPKEDSQVQLMLATRQDIFPDYNNDTFVKEFSQYFDIVNMKMLVDSERCLYLMRKKD